MPEITYADPEIVTFNEAILTVKGVIGWLDHFAEGVSLEFSDAQGRQVTFVPDAKRAGMILHTMMLTSGMA